MRMDAAQRRWVTRGRRVRATGKPAEREKKQKTRVCASEYGVFKNAGL